MPTTIPVYKFKVVSGAIRVPTQGGFDYGEGSYEKLSTSDLTYQSDDFTEYTSLGLAGNLILDSPWVEHPGGWTNGKDVFKEDDLLSLRHWYKGVSFEPI